MDYLLWLILLFVGMFVKCFSALLAFGVMYYIYKKYFDKIIEAPTVLDKYTTKGDNQSLFFFQLNYRTNTYNTMKDIILFPIYLIVGLGVFIFVKEIRQEIIMKVKEEL